MAESFWRDRPTLVTGATGLLGGWTVKRLLAAGADVVCLVRDWVPQSEMVRGRLIDQVKVVRGDIRDPALFGRILAEYEIDTVLHLAAQSIVGTANRDPLTTFDTNIRGVWQLLDACRQIPTVKQVVIASSDKAYGANPSLPYVEDMPLDARYPHDVSKACGDLIAMSYASTYGLPVTMTRCGNYFGGGDLNWNRIIPGAIRSALRGQRPVIGTDGLSVRDYFYVEDGAAAHMLLAERLAGNPELRGHAFNFANETPLTVLELVKRILAVMGSDLEPDVRNRPTNEIREQYVSAAKAKDLLGWEPLYPIDEGLSETIDWYRSFINSMAG
ncbi:MAG: GDP-mannose 4,6-dehydratase [Chloroflexi bacterium]|nr:GDP-mannose 4,6-dehydratase [Chloroflexota bacterium]